MDNVFGAKIVEKDPRDYILGATTITEIPEEYSADISKVPVVNQRKQPACGAHAGSTLKGVLSNDKDNSPRFLWKNIKDNDGFAITDGTDIYSIFRNLKNIGVCDFSLAGNDSTLSLEDYRNLSVTPEMTNDAIKQKIKSYATTYSPTFDQIKQSIYTHRAVIILYRCGKNMYTAKNGKSSWKSKDILPLSPDNFPMDSGHFVVGFGYTKDKILFRNSWSEDWCDKGNGYFKEDYIKYIVAIGTAVDELPSEAIPKFTFTKDLYLGVKDPEVKELQKFLNNNGFSVAQSGAGSKGNETDYFWHLTKDALIKFQKANNIVPAEGYFGRLTRAKINQLLIS